jgi:hypothetical protein
MAKAAFKKHCDRCRPLGREFFTYWYKVFRFDVQKARKILADGRAPVEVDEESVRYSVDSNTIYDEHVAHVDPSYPGIIAHVFHPAPDGTEAHGHVLIDGNHRAARCLRDGIPFFAYILSEEESRAILVRGPNMPAKAPVARRRVQRPNRARPVRVRRPARMRA